MNRVRPAVRPLLAIAVGALLAACGGDGGDGSVGGEATAPPTSVALDDFEIRAPAQATTATTFEVENVGESVHNWTADDETFATDDLQPGQSTMVIVAEPGTYSYRCTIHPDIMIGEITITEAS